MGLSWGEAWAAAKDRILCGGTLLLYPNIPMGIKRPLCKYVCMNVFFYYACSNDVCTVILILHTVNTFIYVGRSYLLKRQGLLASLLKNTRRVYVCIRYLYEVVT